MAETVAHREKPPQVPPEVHERAAWAANALLLPMCVLLPVLLVISLRLVGDRFEYFSIYTADITLENNLYTLAFAIVALLSIAFIGQAFWFYCSLWVLIYCVNFLLIAPTTQFLYDVGFATAMVVLSFPVFAAASALPIRLPIAPISPKIMDRIALALAAQLIVAVLLGASYNFSLVNFRDASELRDDIIELPPTLAYLTFMNICAICPYLVAWFYYRKAMVLAALVVFLSLAFFPITLLKFALLSGPLVFMTLVATRIFPLRVVAVASILIPLAAGVMWESAAMEQGDLTFAFYNMRLVALPASILDHYLEFFRENPYTYFCHVGLLKGYMDCPYTEQLSVVLAERFKLGNMNASFLATEGVAALGPQFMPAAAAMGGLAIAVGKGLARGLPERFVLVSGFLAPILFLNIPLTTFMLTGGYFGLVLLWMITPREGWAAAPDPRHDGTAVQR
jgi:hypothetical protein